MPLNFIDPYTGDEGETCSTSFKAQQDLLGGSSTSNPQTEAEFNKSKMLGEWGVIKAKMAKKEIPHGTKVLTFTNNTSGTRGYLYVKNGALYQKSYSVSGAQLGQDLQTQADFGENFIKAPGFTVTIPQAVAPKPKPEPAELTANDIQLLANDTKLKDGQILAVQANGDFIKYAKSSDTFILMGPADQDGNQVVKGTYYFFDDAVKPGQGWLKPDEQASTPNATPKTSTPPPSSSQVAAPTPAKPVDSASTSVGSMSHEDVSALFVKIKDDLAKEQGLNIKGANPALDVLVYQKIGEATGYTADEVKGKIDAYKAAGNKLSALKKKVMAGTYKVPELKPGQSAKPQPTKASPSAPLNTPKATSKPVNDPQPNGVPTTATPKLADTIKTEVKKEAEKAPQKVYTDEDVAAAYIIAKDAIVASNTKGWTLYTKNDEFDLEIAIAVGLKTGLNPAQQKQAIANYLASGKKLSVLKKQLAKQGAFKPQADTLKAGKTTPKDAKAKAEDVSAKADQGYTPTPTPATGTPKTDTGNPAPKKVEREAKESGDISGIGPTVKKLYFDKFKATGSKSWLSSGSGQNYEGFAAVLAEMQTLGHSKNLTMLQLIRVVDEEGAKKAGVANGHLFEKQVATWLTTPEGTQYIKDKEAALAKQAAAAKAKAEAEAKAKELEKNQPALPADSAQFQPWDLEKAKRVSATWLEANPWTTKQRRDLVHYTGSAYVEMNTWLRTDGDSSISSRSLTAIKGAQEGMRPTTEPILVRRGSGAAQFSALGLKNGDGALTFGLTGKTFKDEGFLSTSAGGRAAFGGECKLEIECPIGTPMAYVAPISKYPSENEMLLQAGMEYKVLNVRREDGVYVIRMRVVNWPGKES